MISQTKALKVKSFLLFNFTITAICVVIRLAEDGTRMRSIYFRISPSYKENEKLKHFSYCVISDQMEQDVAIVYPMENEVLKKVLANLPEIKDVTYFSDGSPYKNQKNLFNLCQHSSEFRINAKSDFFATSHGK